MRFPSGITSAKKYRWFIALLLLKTCLFSVGPSPAAVAANEPRAADHHELSGEVKAADEELVPLPGATVEIAELGRGTTTDAEGRFTFTDVPAGVYTLHVRFVGYAPAQESVEVPQEEPLIVHLRPAEIQAGEVVVTASPLSGRAYQAAQAFPAAELQRQAAASFGELLDGEPGLAMRSFGPAPSRPVIRGFDGDRVLILENGERMGDLSATAHDHAIALDPLVADRVEVVRGPASLLYGAGALGGVVNLMTSDIPRGWAPGSTGSMAFQGATVNEMAGGFGRITHGDENWAATGRMVYRRAGNVHTPEGELPGTYINNVDAALGVGYDTPGLSGGIAFTGLNSTYGVPEELDDPDEHVEIRFNRQSVQGQLETAGDGLIEGIELRFHGSRLFQQEVEMELESDGTIDEDIELEFAQLSGSTTLTLRHQPLAIFESGIVGASIRGRDLDIGGLEAFTPGMRGGTFSIFTFQEVALTEATRLQLGLRSESDHLRTLPNDDFPEADDERSSMTFSGAVGLNTRPVDRLEIGTQVARAYRTPMLEELFADGPHVAAGVYEVGNRDLQNETSLGADVFGRWRTGWLYAEVAGFYHRINDYVAFQPAGETDVASGLPIFNYEATDATMTGGEAYVRLQLPTNLQVSATTDYVRGTRVDTAEPLPFIPPLRGRLSLRYEPDSWWIEGISRLVDAQNRTALAEAPTEGYALFNLEAGFRVNEIGQHVITARVENLTNVVYRDHLSRVGERRFPMPGRNVSLTYRWLF